MNLAEQLDQLSHNALKQLVLSVYGIYGDVDDIIERHLQTKELIDSDIKSVVASFRVQISQLINGNDYYGYHDTDSFVGQIDHFLSLIGSTIREKDPIAAMELNETLLLQADKAMQMVHDSSCGIDYTFSLAVEQWLDIAAQVRKSNPDFVDWVGKVKLLLANNDYAVLGNLLPSSAILLTRQELAMLAEEFESTAEEGLKSSDRSRYSSAATALYNLKDIAKALNDIELFEKAVLLQTPEPNEIQASDIVRFCFKTENWNRARGWLEKPIWDKSGYNYQQLISELLKGTGDTKALKKHLKQAFDMSPSMYSLESYWEVASDTDKKTVQKTLIKLSEQERFRHDSIEMLLFVGEYQSAAKLVIAHSDKIDGNNYYSIREYAEAFQQNNQPLAAIICYRALLTSLLERGYAKAYHHGADYFHKLLELDKCTPDYQGMQSAQDYIRAIQSKHWRKRSFWAEANYPNKP